MTDIPTIWHSDFLIAGDYSAGEYLRSIEVEGTQPIKLVKRNWKIKSGYALDRSEVSKYLQLTEPQHDERELPDFFRGLFPCVSQRFARFLEESGIKDVVFYPVDIYLSDGITKRPYQYFIMNLRSQKRCWVAV